MKKGKYISPGDRYPWKSRFDSSRESLEKLGINVTDELWNDLIFLNTNMATEYENCLAFKIILLLKALKLIGDDRPVLDSLDGIIIPRKKEEY